MPTPTIQKILYSSNKPKLLLDKVQGAVAAYGLQKLSSSYSGALIRVRRETDSAELDIYANAVNNLDTTTLLSFAGSDIVYIVTMYDLTGGGNNITQSDSTRQARIVNNGALEEAVYFDGSNDFHSAPNSSSLDILNAPLSMYAEYKPEVTTSGYVFCKNLDSSTNVQYGIVSSTVATVYLGNASRNSSLSTAALEKQKIISVWDGTSSKIYQNGTLVSNNSSYTISFTSRPNFQIGCRAATGGTYSIFFKGWIHKIAIFNSDISNYINLF